MLDLLPILARKSEDDWIKFVFVAVVVVIWIAGAIISAINKRVEDAKRRQRFGQLPQDLRQRVPPQAQRIPQPPEIPAHRQKRQKRRAAPVPQQIPVAEPPPLRAAAAYAPAAEPAPAQVPRPVPEAARVARLARRSDSLRAGFILSEVLGPPASMRSESGR